MLIVFTINKQSTKIKNQSIYQRNKHELIYPFTYTKRDCAIHDG